MTLLDAAASCANIGTRLKLNTNTSYKWLKDGAVISGATAIQYTATTVGTYRAVVTSSNGCSDSTRSVPITINPVPVPNFTINNATQCLTGNAFTYTNTSTLASGTMSSNWNLGNATSSVVTSPTVTYAAANTYTVKLVVLSDKLCRDSISKTVTVVAMPTIPVVNSAANEFCTGTSLTLTTTGIPALQWYKNSVLISGATSTSLPVNQPGDYMVQSKNGNGCISQSLVKTIVENPLPVGSINLPDGTIICEGTPFTLTATGGNTYQWYLNNTLITGATNTNYYANTAGTYTMDVISAKGCMAKGTNSVSLTLQKKPTAQFGYDTYCVGVFTNFTSTSTVNNSGNVTYTWRFGTGATVSGSSASYTYSSVGSYNARLIVTPTSCPMLADSTERTITVQLPLTGITYPPVNAIVGKGMVLSARNIGNTYTWSPATYLSSAYSRTPTVTPLREQLYRIYITNAAGCLTVDTLTVRVFNDRDIYVPQGFSPDNDGRNDRLYPILVGIQKMNYFKVFNRWGILVYDNANANANTGWDGTYMGKPQPLESYAWVAEGIDIDGKIIRRSGNVILVR